MIQDNKNNNTIEHKSKTGKNGRNSDGTFNVGNPYGRPKGVRNKYTVVKNKIMKIFEDTQLDERIKVLVRNGEDPVKIFREVILPVLPREPMVVNQTNNIVKIDVGWSDKEDSVQIHPTDVPETDT